VQYGVRKGNKMNLPIEMVQIREGKPVVSSLQVAEKSGKRHDIAWKAHGERF
jgi:hypothetical protein